MSLQYLGKHEPGNCLINESGKLGICRDHPHRQIEMKFCVVGVLQGIVLRFEYHQNMSSDFGAVCGQNLPFSIGLAIGLYRIVISQCIKEVIANRHEKLNRLMIAQTP